MFERRPYFVFGDLLCNSAAGAIVAVVVTSLVAGDWPSLVGMLVGMVVGSLIATLLSVAGSAIFGALEVMLPMMTTGMVVGMLSGMTRASRATPLPEAALGGALVGLAVLVGTYFLNAYVRSQGDLWTS